MFGFIILPVTFLGGTYYEWTRLAPIKVDGWHWLQTVVLINPLIYVNEGMRAALTNAPHMHLYVVYPVLIGFLALFLALSASGTSGGGKCCPGGPGPATAGRRSPDVCRRSGLGCGRRSGLRTRARARRRWFPRHPWFRTPRLMQVLDGGGSRRQPRYRSSI